MMPPANGTGKSNYLAAVTQIDENMVFILDVERILSGIHPLSMEVSEELADISVGERLDYKIILIIDDSAVARNQVKRALEPLELTMLLAKNGQDVLEKLF
jgi:two-component system chemotaxis response regulator CheV